MASLFRKKYVPLALFLFIAGLSLSRSYGAQDKSIKFEIIPEKDEFLLGEPVLVIAKFRNEGSEPIIIHFGWGSIEAYTFRIVDEKGNIVAKPYHYRGEGIGWFWVVEAMPEIVGEMEVGMTAELDPGKTIQHKLILDLWHPIGKPGSYKVYAMFGGTTPGGRVGFLTSSGKMKEVEIGYTPDDLYTCEFTIKVSKPDPIKLKAICEKYFQGYLKGSRLDLMLLTYVRSDVAVPYLERAVEMEGPISDRTQLWCIEGLGRIISVESANALVRLWRMRRKLDLDGYFILAQIRHMREVSKDPRILKVTDPLIPYIKKVPKDVPTSWLERTRHWGD